MIYANILKDERVIGSIDQEAGGFRISWRERMESGTGNVHTIGRELHPTPEAARQAVYRVDAEVQIVKVAGGT